MKKIVLFLMILFFNCRVLAYFTNATSTVLMDTDNNRLIYADNAHQIRSVASISKIMTAVLAIESGKLDEKVIVGAEISKSYGSGIYIKQGEVMTLKDLVYGLMLRSGNDAALAIATFVGGNYDDFVKLMNKKAKDLGMKNTTFNNPCGLDEAEFIGNFSTAYDMAILTSYAMQKQEYRQITKTKKYQLKTNLNTYNWTNKNRLLTSYKYATGGKTGFTKKARRTLVTTASKNGVNLVAVTLNDGNDFLDHQNLFEEAFSEFKNYQILKKGPINIASEKYYQENEIYLKDDFSYILADNEKDNVVLKFELNKKYDYEDNSKIGKVKVMLAEEQIYEAPLYIKLKHENNQSLWDKILGWFK